MLNCHVVHVATEGSWNYPPPSKYWREGGNLGYYVINNASIALFRSNKPKKKYLSYDKADFWSFQNLSANLSQCH